MAVLHASRCRSAHRGAGQPVQRGQVGRPQVRVRHHDHHHVGSDRGGNVADVSVALVVGAEEQHRVRTEVVLGDRVETLLIAAHLTPGELRVLYAVIELGGGVRAIADVLGISQATVKTHLHHIFQKTGTRRQIDLVKLVAGISNPSIE